MPLTDEQKQRIEELMEKADILGVTIAEFDLKGIRTEEFGNTADKSGTLVAQDTVFGAASLSKPVFAYLVNKIANDPQFKNFTLDTPLHTILKDEKISGDPAHEKLTARLILSHQAGWPNRPPKAGQQSQFQFQPGEEFAYSGVPYGYLQRVIEKVTGQSLQECARKYVFDDCQMSNKTTFIPPAGSKVEIHPANSLSTTAHDYALFCQKAIKDKKLFEVVCPLSPERDKMAANQGLTKEDLQKVAWGVGWGLQKTAEGEVTRAFHYGDMGKWRAFVALDLEKGAGVVYFANSPGGFLLADTIISPPIVELNDGLKFFFEKLGFAREFEPGWQKEERLRIDGIIEKNQPDLWKVILEFRAAEAKAKAAMNQSSLPVKEADSLVKTRKRSLSDPSLSVTPSFFSRKRAKSESDLRQSSRSNKDSVDDKKDEEVNQDFKPTKKGI